MNHGSAELFGSALLPQRFWDKIRRDDRGCWLWTGHLNDKRYGMYFHEGRHQRAHRVAFLTLAGGRSEDTVLDHLCRVRHCVNPDHLESVTHQTNLLRGATLAAENADKTHCIHGHRFDDANTYVCRKGARHCRACARERMRAYYRASRAS